MANLHSLTEASFNMSVYQENEANRWKFLKEMNPVEANQAGFFLQSPLPIITLTLSYILFVCIIGPRFMRNREPFQLKNLIRFYNLLMVLLAGILLIRLYDSIESVGSMFDCRKMFTFADQTGAKIYQMSNFILIVRLSEYLDTIFFTLRKKQNQVTFLHVFHHSFVPLYAYWVLRTAPLRFNSFIILVNSFIHVFMYSYYFLATFQSARGSDKEQSKQSSLMIIITKLLMFKRYMTQLQILQFVGLALYAIWTMARPEKCGVPWTYITANLLLAFGFLSLFLHFYISVYKSSVIAAKTKRN